MPIPSPYFGNDYVVITGNGATFAVGADPILASGGYTYYVQFYKLGFGPTGAFTPVDSATPFPVTVTTGLTAIVSGFTGPIVVEGYAGGYPIDVSGTVTVNGVTSGPVYVQTPPNCYVEVTGGQRLNKNTDSISVWGPSGITWLYANLKDSNGAELGITANPLKVSIIGATINATVSATVGVTNSVGGVGLQIQGSTGGILVGVTVGNTLTINDSAIISSISGVCAELNSLNSQILSIAGSVPSTFTSNKISISPSSSTQIEGITGFTCAYGINLKASATNTNLIYFGNTSAVSSSTGYGLDPGEEVFVKILNANKLYVISGSGTQSMFYVAS